MPKVTSAYAKNTIRRALRAIVDGEPSRAAIAELWHYFESQCAYCGRPLDKVGRGGHIDHLVPTTAGGTNHVSNRVLACPPCNGDEKREGDWLEFLRKKVPDKATRISRHCRIKAWIARTSLAERTPADQKFLQREIARAIAAFDSAVQNLRGRKLAADRLEKRAIAKVATNKRSESAAALGKQPIDFRSLKGLAAFGFEGGRTIRQLQASFDLVPAVRGVYLVVRKGLKPALFRERSTGGHFKGRDPTVAVEELANRWLSAPRVLYVGKAGARNQTATLRSRLKSYVQFGTGTPCAHWGGRYVWQLSDAEDLCIYWKPTPTREPAVVESELLRLFSRRYGQLPFANLRL